MRSQHTFGDGAGFEQGEAEQHRVTHDAPDRVDGISHDGNILDENGVDRNADQNEEPLKAQSEQAFQIVLPHVALLVISEGRHRERSKADHAVDLDHSAVDDDKDDDGEDAHGDADEEGLQEQAEQGTDIHLHHAGLQDGKPDVVHLCVPCDDTAGLGDHLLGQVEHRHDDIKGVGDEPD